MDWELKMKLKIKKAFEINQQCAEIFEGFIVSLISERNYFL